MNALTETTIVIKTQRATTMMDHLVAPAILASLEMELIVKTLMTARLVMIVPLTVHVLMQLEASIVFVKLAIKEMENNAMILMNVEPTAQVQTKVAPISQEHIAACVGVQEDG